MEGDFGLSQKTMLRLKEVFQKYPEIKEVVIYSGGILIWL
jgi:hypothetical protein